MSPGFLSRGKDGLDFDLEDDLEDDLEGVGKTRFFLGEVVAEVADGEGGGREDSMVPLITSSSSLPFLPPADLDLLLLPFPVSADLFGLSPCSLFIASSSSSSTSESAFLHLGEFSSSSTDKVGDGE